MSEEGLQKQPEVSKEKKILTEEEIDALKEIHLQKKKLRQIFLLVGVILIALTLIFGVKNGAFVMLVYAIPILIVGLYILLNKNEDKIEQIREAKK